MRSIGANSVALLGYEPSALLEARPAPFARLVHPDDRDIAWQVIQQSLSDRRPFYVEYRIGTADNAERWVCDQGWLVGEEQNEPPIIEGVIAERTRPEQMSGVSPVPGFAPLANADEQVEIHLDVRQRVRSLNLSAERLLQKPAGQIIGQRLSQLNLLKGPSRGAVAQLLRETMRGEFPRPIQVMLAADGQHCRLTIEPDRADGPVTGARLVLSDFAHAPAVTLTPQLRERQTQSLLDGLSAFVWTARIKAPGKWDMSIVSGKAFERVTGFEPGDLYGRSLPAYNSLVLPEDLPGKDQAGRTVEAGTVQQYYHEYRIRRRDGQIRWLGESARVAGRREQELLVVGVCLDITDRRIAQQHSQQLAKAVEQAGEIMVLMDPAGVIQFANPAFTRLLSFPAEEAVGRPIRAFLHSPQIDTHILNDGGDPFRTRVTANCREGGTVTLDANFSRVLGPDGRLQGFVCVAHDMTDTLREQSRDMLAQKLEAVATLAGGVAHDFNNLLFIILGYTSLMRADLPEGDRNSHALDMIEQAGNRAVELTRQLLDFSRRRRQERAELDVHKLIDQTIRDCRTRRKSQSPIERDLRAEAPVVMGDSSQLQQVLLNLLNNALDATAEGGRVRLSTRSVEFDEFSYLNHGLCGPGLHLVIDVADTGCGIPDDLRERVFEPFFTTKDTGKGTGMGLAVVYGIVKDHGGSIHLAESAGTGVTFRIYLPAQCGAPSTRAPRRRKRASLVSGQGRILLVDDESAVRKVASDMLRKLGYDVAALGSAEEAVEYCQRHGHQVDLAILDLTMPDRSGLDCYTQLKAIHPHLKAVLATSESDRAIAGEAAARGIKHILVKPFDMHSLGQRLHEVLNPS